MSLEAEIASIKFEGDFVMATFVFTLQEGGSTVLRGETSVRIDKNKSLAELQELATKRFKEVLCYIGKEEDDNESFTA
jgi:hypothetical protein